MIILVQINKVLGNYDNIIGVMGVVVAIIGIIVGCCGKKQLKAANELKIQVGELKAEVEKLEISDSQFAKVINNNGIDLKDADYLVNKTVNEKSRNKPDVIYSDEEPHSQKNGDVWMKPVE